MRDLLSKYIPGEELTSMHAHLPGATFKHLLHILTCHGIHFYRAYSKHMLLTGIFVLLLPVILCVSLCILIPNFS